MAAIPSLPFNIKNGTPADATQVMADFNLVWSYLDGLYEASGVTPGTYGSAGGIPQITVNSRGQITSVTTITDASDLTSTATGSITARSAADRDADIFNILDYGGKGDGAFDNATAIAAALTEIGTNGGTLYFPFGTYRFSAFPAITANNIYLRGAGIGATVLAPTYATGNVIQFGTNISITARCGVSDLMIVPTIARTGGANIFIGGAAQIQIDNVQMIGGFDGLAVETYGNQSGLYISTLIMLGLTGEAMPLGKASATVVNEIFIDKCTIASCTNGINIYCASGIYASNISLFQSANNGVAFLPSGNGIFGLWFSNCLMDTCTGVGWYFANTFKMGNINLSNCAGNSCGRGLQVATGCLLNGLACKGLNVENNSFEGILCQAGKNLLFDSCTAWCNSTSANAGFIGISFAPGCSEFNVINCFSGLGGFLEANGGANKQSFGIAIDNSVNNYSVIGCNTPGNQTAGFFGIGGTATQVVANNRHS